jgi:hypothetical protein
MNDPASENKAKVGKDHYVPQFYLEEFAFDKDNERPHIYQYMIDNVIPARVKDVASERHFYTVKEKGTGGKLRIIESFLSAVESNASGPLRHIISTEDIRLSDIDRQNLALFIAVLATRTPSFIEGLQSMMEESTKEFMSLEAMDIDRLRENMSKNWTPTDRSSTQRTAEIHD